MIKNTDIPIKLKQRSHSSISHQTNYNLDTYLVNNKTISQFVFGETLGEGSFGKVCLAKHILTGEKVAIKILERSKIKQKSDKKRIDKEISIFKRLHHANIIRLYSVIETIDKIHLIMEYANGQELYDYIQQEKFLKEEEACSFFQQMISGVEYLHKIGIVHRDLKPQNLLLTQLNELKIADFGLSNIFKKSDLLSTACGSPYYAAPEMLKGNSYIGPLVDIWSCGVILYVMLCGNLPFDDTNIDSLYKKIINGKFKIPKTLSKNAQDLIVKMLEKNPRKRITINKIKQHPWFKTIEPKEHMHKGIDVKKTLIPIDEEIVTKMVEYGYNKSQVEKDLMLNEHNNGTTTYYLFTKKKIRKGIQSVSDFKSEVYELFISSKYNQLSTYNGSLVEALKNRCPSMDALDSIPSRSNEDEKNKDKVNIDNNSPNIQKQKDSYLSECQSAQKEQSLISKIYLRTYSTNRDNKNEDSDTVKKLKSKNGKIEEMKCYNKRGANSIEISIGERELLTDSILSENINYNVNNNINSNNINNMRFFPKKKKNPINLTHKKKFKPFKLFNPNYKTHSFNDSLSKENENDQAKSSQRGVEKTLHTFLTETIKEKKVIYKKNTNLTRINTTSKNKNKKAKINKSCEMGNNISISYNNDSINKRNKTLNKDEGTITLNFKLKKNKYASLSMPKSVKGRNNSNNIKRVNDYLRGNKMKTAKTSKRLSPINDLKLKNIRAKQKENNGTEKSTITDLTNRSKNLNLSSIENRNNGIIKNKINNSNMISISPIPLSCIFYKKIKELKEQIAKILKIQKIKFQIDKKNANKYLCYNHLNELKFNMEILYSNESENVSALKFQRLNGDYFSYQKIVKGIYSRIC